MTDSWVLVCRLQELTAFPLCFPLRYRSVAQRFPLQSRGPVADEVLDLLLLEIHQSAFNQALYLGPYLLVADDATGEDKLVAFPSLHAEEIRHSIHHQAPLRWLSDLIQTVEQEQGGTVVQGLGQNGGEGQVDASIFEIVPDEAMQRHVCRLQSIGVGRKGYQNGQPPAQAQSLSLGFGQRQGEVLQEGGLARSGVAQDDQAVLLAQHVQHGSGFAQPGPYGLLL